MKEKELSGNKKKENLGGRERKYSERKKTKENGNIEVGRMKRVK